MRYSKDELGNGERYRPLEESIQSNANEDEDEDEGKDENENEKENENRDNTGNQNIGKRKLVDYKILLQKNSWKRRLTTNWLPSACLVLVYHYINYYFYYHAYHLSSIPCNERQRETRFVMAASAQELVNSENSINDPSSLPVPQALIYNLEPFAHEFGSGDHDQYGRGQRKQTGFTSSSSSSATENSDLSGGSSLPSLIEAKCWNNLAEDNDCRHLNIITGPVDQSAANRAQWENGLSSGGSMDSLITPTVIFEASSIVSDNQNSEEQLYTTSSTSSNERPRHRVHHLTPPYHSQSTEVAPKSSSSTQRTPTATVSPASGFSEPATRPSVENFVATTGRPRPKQGSSQPEWKCRGGQDSDCNESEAKDPDLDETAAREDGPKSPSGTGSRKQPASTRPSLPEGFVESGDEFGSGDGPNGASNMDDTEDSRDDGDEEDEPEEADTERRPVGGPDDDERAADEDEDSGSELSGQSPESELGTETGKSLLEISTLSSASSAGAASEPAHPPPTRTSEQATPSATIDLVVHSSLPSGFPTPSAGHQQHLAPSFSSTTSTSTSTTPMPDETVYTSRPIFPSSTGANSDAAWQATNNFTQEPDQPSTPTEDLNTFRPIPLPSELPLWRGGVQPASPASASRPQMEPDSAGLTAPPPPPARQRPLGPLWTTHWPQVAPATSEQPLVFTDGLGGLASESRAQKQSHHLASGGALQSASLGRNGPMGTDMLPTLLLYASVIILATTSVIFVVMALIFWRRNNERRQLLLRKLHQANGTANLGAQMGPNMLPPGLPNGPPPPMGQQPQLQAPLMVQPQQVGLMSTYATLGKTANGNPRVTTNLVPSSADNQTRVQPVEDEEDERRMEADDGDCDEEAEGEDDKTRLVGGGQSAAGGMMDISMLANEAYQQASHIRQPNNLAQQRQARPGQHQSWGSADEQTSSTTTTTSSSLSANSGPQHLVSPARHPAGNPQQQQQQQQQQSPQAASQQQQNYQNKLVATGSQHSSSISESQSSSEGSTHQTQSNPANTGIAMAGPAPGQFVQTRHMQPMANYPIQRAPMQMGGAILGPMPQNLAYPMRQPHFDHMPVNRFVSPMQQQQMPNQQHVIIVQNNGTATPPPAHMQLKHRYPLPHSRSIEALDRPRNGYHHTTNLANLNFSPIAMHQHMQHRMPLVTNGHMLPANNNALFGPQEPTGRVSAARQEQYIGPTAVGMLSPSHRMNQVNSVATLGRRFALGLGLNRNIYSEDSSSFITTSPSLARTSSSSSFAFNSIASTVNLAPGRPPTNGPPPPVKPKPTVDGTDGIFSDYTAYG